MKKYIIAAIAVFMLLTPVTANAAKVTLDGLTATQAAEFKLQAEQIKERGGVVRTTPAEVKEWVAIGASVGEALAATAKSLGQEVNTFATTTVGKLAIFLIVWHMFGAMMVHVFFGMFFFITAMWIWFKLFKKVAFVPQEEKIISKMGFKVRTIKYFDLSEMSPQVLSDLQATRIWFWFTASMIVAVTMFTLFTW